LGPLGEIGSVRKIGVGVGDRHDMQTLGFVFDTSLYKLGFDRKNRVCVVMIIVITIINNNSEHVLLMVAC